MARTPHKPAPILPAPNTVADAHALTLAEDQETNAIESEMAFKAAEAIGMLKALEFSETVSARAKVEVFLSLGKSKAYKAVFVTDEDGNRKRISDLDEFCERFLGKSARRMRQQAADYHLLGGELFEASQRIGFRNQDYQALRALPADDQAIIKQAMAEEATRDQVIDLLQEMAARHASEKAALESKAKEAEETAEARSDVIAKKETMINTLQESNSKLKRRQTTFTDEEKRDYECAPLHDTINEAMVALVKMATEVKRLIEEVGGELVTEECFHAVLLPIKRALEIAAHNGLHIDLATLFDEQIDASLEDLQARAAGLTPGALQ